jgi:hypothetical protein
LEFGEYNELRTSSPIDAVKSAVSVVELDELEVEFAEFDVEFNRFANVFDEFTSFRSDAIVDVEPMISP